MPAAGFCSDIIRGNKIAHTQKGQLCAEQKEVVESEPGFSQESWMKWEEAQACLVVQGSSSSLSAPEFDLARAPLILCSTAVLIVKVPEGSY